MAANPRDDDQHEPESEDYPTDWRTRVVTHTTSDIPVAYPGGPSHRAGALVVVSTVAKDAKGRNSGFASPSAVALALSLAMKAAGRARELQNQIEESETVTPWGPGTSITIESLPALYDYLEECMAVLTFSFQALEAYCNEMISDKLTGTYTRARGKNRSPEKLAADDLERAASTEEKLGTILPELLGIPSPKGSRLWQDFVELKDARDATIHIKSLDSAPRIMQPSDLDYPTLFHRFLGANVAAWPKVAVALVLYFAAVTDTPPWLEHARKTLGVQAKGPALNQAKVSQLPRGASRRAAAGGF